MRRMTRRDDLGVATIFVVLALPALLMMASLVFDGARGILAARQSQNAADAAALATATDCANGTAGTNLTPYATNGTTLTSTGCGTASTTATATKKIGPTFTVEGGPWTVTRSATAQWGAINSATTVPAVISACVFDIATSDGTVFPSTTQVIPIGGGATNCPGRPPGNFGWLNDPGSTCAVTTTLTSAGTVVAAGSNGNSSNQPYYCINGVTAGGYGSEILFPIYTATSGTGSAVTYTLSGYAQFHISGWDFQNGPQPKQYPTGGLPSCTSHDCIQGYFVKFVTGQGTTGSSSNFGAVTVQLSS
jgi:Flp pilus assembly protein TadG